MAQLPYDVWLEIVPLLDMDTLRNLRYLNSTLREIALDAIYNTVTFSLKSLESTQHNDCFLKFRDNHLARRVQNLGYYTGVDTSFPEDPTLTKTVQQYVREHFGVFSISRLDRAIVETATRFVNVSSLEFCHLGNEEKSLRKSILILNTTLRTCFNSLKALALQLPIAYISEVTLATLFIPNLASLCISPNYSREKSNYLSRRRVDLATITTFLNRHRSTLAALHLRLDPDSGQSLFNGLDHMAMLKEFSVVISQSTRLQYLVRFLRNHSQNLEKLHLITAEATFRSLDQVFEDDTVSFPELQDFCAKSTGDVFPQDFDHSFFGHSFVKTGRRVFKSAASLVSLSILSAPMNNDEFFEFLPPHTYNKLQDLHISLDFLSCQTLDFLENALPNLLQLEINASRVKSAQSHPIQVREEYLVIIKASRFRRRPRSTDLRPISFALVQFLQELSYCDYSRWKLEEFKLLIDVRSLSAPTVERVFYSVLAIAMRSLQTFNSVLLADFISTGPLPIVL